MSSRTYPRIGDPILVIKQPWLDLILDGRKTLEVRGTSVSFLNHGDVVFLSQSRTGEIQGRMRFVSCEPLHRQDWDARRDEHLIPGAITEWEYHPITNPRGYKRLFGWKLSHAERLGEAVPYHVVRGTVIWRRFARSARELQVWKETHAGRGNATGRRRTATGRRRTATGRQRITTSRHRTNGGSATNLRLTWWLFPPLIPTVWAIKGINKLVHYFLSTITRASFVGSSYRRSASGLGLIFFSFSVIQLFFGSQDDIEFCRWLCVLIFLFLTCRHVVMLI